MKLLLNLIVLCGTLACLWSCQDEKKPDLLPGEVTDPRSPVPIITAVRDTSCTDSLRCPAKGADCITQQFTVLKDTFYFLTVSYFNGDTVVASCRACGSVFAGDSVIMSRETACPTGGPWVTGHRLVPGVTYTLSVCLQRCGIIGRCSCEGLRGERGTADAIVSIRRVWE